MTNPPNGAAGFMRRCADAVMAQSGHKTNYCTKYLDSHSVSYRRYYGCHRSR
jgi:hypothetical protein